MNLTRAGLRAIPVTLILLFFGALPCAAQVAPFSSFEGLSVTTAERTEVSRLTDGGVVSVEGASGFVVTVAGELRGRAEKDGAVGVLLVPKLPFFGNLYRNRRILLSAAEFTAPVSAGASSYFISPSKHSAAGFPTYHLYLFNTTGTSAIVNVYVYPTRS